MLACLDVISDTRRKVRHGTLSRASIKAPRKSTQRQSNKHALHQDHAMRTEWGIFSYEETKARQISVRKGSQVSLSLGGMRGLLVTLGLFVRLAEPALPPFMRLAKYASRFSTGMSLPLSNCGGEVGVKGVLSRVLLRSGVL